MSFGYKMAVAAAEVARHRRRSRSCSRIAVGKMSGAVGTGAGFGIHAEAVESAVMLRLGLQADEAPTQIIGRDRIAELTNLLALISGTAERLATEVRNLQRTEIGEVAEAFDEARQVGSSTMAQKRNPMLSENVSSLARLVRAFALPPLENMVQWHERDLANSANERIVLPHALVLTDDILAKLIEVFERLHVDAAAMERHLAEAGGGAMTESLMLALAARGLPRSEAHELLRALTRDLASGDELAKRASHDPTVTKFLKAAEVVELLDPARLRRVGRREDRSDPRPPTFGAGGMTASDGWTATIRARRTSPQAAERLERSLGPEAAREVPRTRARIGRRNGGGRGRGQHTRHRGAARRPSDVRRLGPAGRRHGGRDRPLRGRIGEALISRARSRAPWRSRPSSRTTSGSSSGSSRSFPRPPSSGSKWTSSSGRPRARSRS